MITSHDAPILGIDLGTTTSLACVLGDHPRDGQNYPTMIQTDNVLKTEIMPSLFCLTEDGPLVGNEARELLRNERYRDYVVSNVKRSMGADAAFTFESITGRLVTPTYISGIYLKTLREAAEKQLALGSGAITKAVVTVPANFGHVERGHTVKAAEEYGGFSEVHLLDEPIAAAIGLNLHRQRKRQLVLVLDLGGGTLDVTLLLIGKGVGKHGFREMGRGGCAELGGVNWDEEIARFVVKTCDKTRGPDFRRDINFFDYTNVDLYEPCEMAKHNLCRDQSLRKVNITYRDKQLGEVVDCGMTRNEFRVYTIHWAKLCAAICNWLLMDIHSEDREYIRRYKRGWLQLFSRKTTPLSWREIDRVFLVGGASKIPAVKEHIAEYWGQEPTVPDRPQHQVAYGAATCAASLESGDGLMSDMQLRSPHTTGYYGMATSDGESEFHPIIRRNKLIPTTARITCPIDASNAKGTNPNKPFRVNIVEEQFEYIPFTNKRRKKRQIVERLEIRDLPTVRQAQKDFAEFIVDYPSERELSFKATVRGKVCEVKLNGGSAKRHT